MQYGLLVSVPAFYSFNSRDPEYGEEYIFCKTLLYLKMGQPRSLFFVLFSFFLNKRRNFYNKSTRKNVMSVQYTVSTTSNPLFEEHENERKRDRRWPT